MDVSKKDKAADSGADTDGSNVSDHQIPGVPQVTESLPDEAQFEEPVASPNVTGEEDASGDAPSGEPVDIDEQLKKVGLAPDSEES